MKKKLYTSSFTVVRGACAVQNEHVFSIAAKTPDDCAGMKHIPELVPGWDIVGPYKKAEKSGLDMTAAEEAYKKAYYNNILKNLNPDIIPDGAILCCYENSSKFCHRQLVAKWAVWADKNVEFGGELDTAKKVFDVLAKDIQVGFDFEEETEMKNEVINNVATDTIVAQTNTVNTVVENNTMEKEEIEMTNVENKAAEVRNAIEAANAAEIVKIDATKKYIELRDAARVAMLVKKIATCKHQIANVKVRLLKAEFSVIEISGKIEAAVEAGKATTTLEKRIAKAQERIAKAQDKLAAYEEKLAGLTASTPEVATTVVKEQVIETSTIVEEPVIDEETTVVDEQLFLHVNNMEVAVDLITKKAAIHAELDELDKERIAAGDWIEKDDPVIENDDELDFIVETEDDDNDEPEVPVSFAAPKVVRGSILSGKTVIGTVEEPKVETKAVAANSLKDLIAKRAATVVKQETVEKKDSAEAPKTFMPIPAVVPAVKQETVPAPVAPKPFVPANPFKNVGVAAPAPVAKKSTEGDGWVINEPIEFDEEIELELGRNRDGSKKTWGTWILEQTADEVYVPVEGQLIPRDDGTFDTPIVEAWFIHGATGTKDKKKNFRDSFLNDDVYEEINLGNAYNFGSEDCTDHDAIMDEIYG